jgi:post-segregation antitoxin (ccd killing protein)
MKKDERVKKNFSIDAKVAKQLEQAARKWKLPMSRILDMALRAYLKETKETGSMKV